MSEDLLDLGGVESDKATHSPVLDSNLPLTNGHVADPFIENNSIGSNDEVPVVAEPTGGVDLLSGSPLPTVSDVEVALPDTTEPVPEFAMPPSKNEPITEETPEPVNLLDLGTDPSPATIPPDTTDLLGDVSETAPVASNVETTDELVDLFAAPQADTTTLTPAVEETFAPEPAVQSSAEMIPLTEADPPLETTSDENDFAAEMKATNAPATTPMEPPNNNGTIEAAKPAQNTTKETSKEATETVQTSDVTVASVPPADQPQETSKPPTSDTQDNNGPANDIITLNSAEALDGMNDTEVEDTPPSTDTNMPLKVSTAQENALLLQRIQELEQAKQESLATLEELHTKFAKEQKDKDSMLAELQSNLQTQMTQRAEAEDAARRATAQAKSAMEDLEDYQSTTKAQLASLQQDYSQLQEDNEKMAKEVEAIREERDEQARKESALIFRLNTFTKKEGAKTNTTEHFQDRINYLEKKLDQTNEELNARTTERNQFQKEVTEWKQYAESRSKQLETALNGEKKLNDERKRKMKEFVEAKTEEVRAAKADQISLQTELDQTSQSLKDFNQRYKQLQAQWVQSQTRNRELQRDITKMQKDSEQMSKLGGTLEAKLSRSAMESEDHKNKRLAAKNELMAVLRQLEVERDVNMRLRESMKMTFTPKALSQQQTLQEAMDDFENALHKLATRLHRPLPPAPVSGNEMLIEGTDDVEHDIGESDVHGGEGHSSNGRANPSDVHTARVLTKLEVETQRVSQHIMTLSSSIERMHILMDSAGGRNCVDALQSLLMSSSSAAPSDETTSMTGTRPRRGNTYGHVPTGTIT